MRNLALSDLAKGLRTSARPGGYRLTPRLVERRAEESDPLPISRVTWLKGDYEVPSFRGVTCQGMH